MSKILLKTGTVLNSEAIECGSNAKAFLNYAFDEAKFDGDIDMVGMRFVHTIQDIVRGIMSNGYLLPADYRTNRKEILEAMPEALEAFEATYPEVPLRTSWSKWLSATSELHWAGLPDLGKYSVNAVVAAAWWEARIIRPGCYRIVAPCELESALMHIAEERDEIDKVYLDFLNGIAQNVDKILTSGKPAIIHSEIDWFRELAEMPSARLAELGEGEGGLSFLTNEIMKVTKTRVLVTGYDCEWIEVMPGSHLNTIIVNGRVCLCSDSEQPGERQAVSMSGVYKACAKHAYGRFVDYAEFSKDD